MLDLDLRRKTPFLPQGEASECGLACLAMIANYHGLNINMVELRHKFPLSLKGATLHQLIHIGDKLGLNIRAVRGDIGDLDHLAMPSILHWDLNHFVVLTKITRRPFGKRYHIHDPASGPLTIKQDRLSRSFTGVALDIFKSTHFHPRREFPSLKISQLWSSLSGFWATIAQIALLSLILQTVILVTPLFMQVAVDSVLPSSDTDLLTALAVGFVGVAVLNAIAAWLRAYTLAFLTNSLSFQVVSNLFYHLIRLPLPWFEKRHVGDVIQRFGSTQPISQMLSQGMLSGFIDGIMALLTVTLMVIYSKLLTSVAVAALFLYCLIRALFLQTIRIANVNSIATAAKENSLLIESIRGIAAIKSAGREGDRQRVWQKKKAEATNAQIKLGRLTAAFDTIGRLIIDIENVVFIFIAISLALNAKFTLGMIFAFQAYKQQFLSASMRLVEQVMNVNVIKVHLARIADIAFARSEEGVSGAHTDAPAFAESIELRNIRYRYGIGEPEVLKGISLSVKAGDVVAFVGPSGGGKTTLMKIMTGLFDPSYGEVFIDGRPASTFGKQAYRRAIGIISQDDQLFSGSIAENIAFFDPDVDFERVEEVARLACIHDDIDRLPLRYDTPVGDMGSTLSGGQKQRVLFARAMYGRPKALFVDEGTAHLDPDTEAKLLQSLIEQKITCIMVAHRAQSIAAAQRIYAISGGQLIAVRPGETHSSGPLKDSH